MLPVVEWPPKTGSATCCFQGTRALLGTVPGAEPRPATHLNLILLIPFHTYSFFTYFRYKATHTFNFIY